MLVLTLTFATQGGGLRRRKTRRNREPTVSWHFEDVVSGAEQGARRRRRKRENMQRGEDFLAL